MLELLFDYGVYGVLKNKFCLGGTSATVLYFGLILVSMIAGYLLGSINTAIIVSKAKFGTDIRELGSKNAGMTNMFRVFGKKGGLLTLAGDALKTFCAVAVGQLLLGYVLGGAYWAGLCCVLGHVFPIFYRFKGGKGVLVTAVMLLFADPLVFVIEFFVFAVILIGTKMVSLASVMSAMLLPLMINSVYAILYGEGNGMAAGMKIPISVVIMLLVIFMHRSNIKRIRDGKESKITLPWEKKKKKDE